MYKGLGVHHVAIGVKNLGEMKTFYHDILGFNTIFIEFDDSPQEMMEGVIRTKPVHFAMVMFSQEPGGILIELAQMSNPVPRDIRKDFRYGDIGVSKIVMAVPDIDKFYETSKDRIKFCSKPKLALIPDYGDYHFVYSKDPEENMIEFVSGTDLQTTNKFGNFRWVGISVMDLESSIEFYQKYLGFDSIYIKTHDSFTGLVDEVSGGNQTEVRSCVLANSKGGGMIELFEVVKPRGRSIPILTKWGDFGYLQACLQCENITDLVSAYNKNGIEFLSELVVNDDASFIYLKDPDGIPLEFLFLQKF